MTLPADRKLPVIPLFGRNTRHSFVPAKICTAVARSGRSRAAVRPARQRFTLDGRKHDGSLAIFRDDAVHSDGLGSLVAVERCSVCRTGIAGHTSSKRHIHPSASRLYHRSIQALRCSRDQWMHVAMHVESGAKQRARSSKGRYCPDADHAKDLDGIARSISSPRRSLRSP